MYSKSVIQYLLILVASRLVPSISSEWDDDAVILSSYHVSSKVNSRLLTTSIDMVFENSGNCSSIYDMTLQLPREARVTELVMDLSDGCQLESRVKNLDDAKEDFEEFSSEGKAAAMLTAWDMSDYKLQVSIPPNGITIVKLKYQELLFQKLDRVTFQVPMFPGIDVEDLKVDVSVDEPNAGLIDFQSNLEDETIKFFLDAKNASMHYENIGVTVDALLPKLFEAYFRPGPPPENGLFLSDGECFTHVFNPTSFLSSAGSMGRKIVFVIDVSGSMSGTKLSDAKASFAVMIDSLDERDTLILQSFSDQGTESLWGPLPASSESKEKAKEFVMDLTTGGGTNLNGAFLDGIEYVINVPDNIAPILVVMTDGQGNSGARDIARNVREANKEKKVKIFSIAFGEYADIDLLLAIAIQNGGRAVRIYEGFGDSVEQMGKFYNEELGTILMSDVNVAYDFGDASLSDSTVSSFPVLAAGSEIVVRGRMDTSMTLNSSRSLKSIISAKSAIGPMEWPIDHTIIPDNTASDCRQSFAQARIVELLEYRDAERSIGDELFSPSIFRSVTLTAKSFEEEARKIALDAQIVWPGLTALITVDNAKCQQKYDICYSGEGRDTILNEGDYDYYDVRVDISSSARHGRSEMFSGKILLLTFFGVFFLLF